MRIWLPFAALVLWLAPVFDCAARLAILTTFSPVHCFAANVAGDAADVSGLVPPNAGPHDYSFSPADIQKIAKADVLVMNGAGLESWLQKGIKSAGRKDLLIIDTSAGIHLITGLEVRSLPDVHAEPDPDAGHGGIAGQREAVHRLDGLGELRRREQVLLTEPEQRDRPDDVPT